jgi:hypothetical protein
VDVRRHFGGSQADRPDPVAVHAARSMPRQRTASGTGWSRIGHRILGTGHYRTARNGTAALHNTRSTGTRHHQVTPVNTAGDRFDSRPPPRSIEPWSAPAVTCGDAGQGSMHLPW